MAGMPPAAGQPFTLLAVTIPAMERPPCRLSTQALVDLLKMPTCTSGARRIILDQLGYRYHRMFLGTWHFVHFAEEQKLGLDFTTPSQLPPTYAAKK